MKNVALLVWGCFLLFGPFGATAKNKPSISNLTGTWVVTSEFCDHCGVSSHADDGRKLVLGKSSYIDPYNFDCPAGATYGFETINRADAQKLLSVPRNVYEIAQPTVTLVRLECPSQVGNAPPVLLTSAEMILVGKDRAIYLWNGGTNFILSHVLYHSAF
jgi:hypothetical protein